ncbi:hypothetical protein SBADM41S_08476 [Streptomyces badius]
MRPRTSTRSSPSAISSPGKKADNYTKMTQAPLCVATNPEGPDCPPRKPKPETVSVCALRPPYS